MIIYIPLEIPVRELPGHLLLATVAASNGHQTVIASQTDIWLYLRTRNLKSGAYLIKNMNIPSSSSKVYQQFLKRGFDIYCQDQEPPILWDRFEKYLLDYNITSNQMLPFKAVFCYGQRDTTAYTTFFRERGNIFYNTGAPRIDMWSKKFNSLHIRDEQKTHQPYLLFVSNFGWWMGNRHMSEFVKGFQSLELLETIQQDENLIRFLEEDAGICMNFILAVKYTALLRPDLKLLIRPHPTERIDYWCNIFEKNKNVKVINNTESITPWIAGARAVVQNGCTSALEAVTQGVPVISYGPDRNNGELSVPNKLGLRARTLSELDSALEQIFSGKYMQHQEQSEEVLKPLLKTGGNAAIEILQIMEEISHPLSNHKLNILKLRLVRYVKNGIDWIRRQINFRVPLIPAYNLNAHRIQEDVKEIAQNIGLPAPKVQMIGKTGMLIESNTKN